MKIGPFKMETNEMTCEMVDAWIRELKKVRARKDAGDEFIERFNALIAEAQDKGFDFCCRDTGEVLMPKYWVLFDRQEMCPHVSTAYEEDGEG
jgi:hypothetical protein